MLLLSNNKRSVMVNVYSICYAYVMCYVFTRYFSFFELLCVF